MSAPASPGAAFLALCAQHGIDPNSIPDAPGGARRLKADREKNCSGEVQFFSDMRPANLRRWQPRQRPRSPDRQASRDRRRRLGGSSALPDTLRHHYTEGQRAVLCIVAGEVKHHGVCDLPIDKIAALAGVCRTTVQTTLHEARRLGHIKITERPVPGRKHLPNLIEITSPEWRAWIKRGPTAHRPIGSKSVNLVSTTKNTGSQKEAFARAESPQGAIRGVRGASSGPPDPRRTWRYGT